MKKRILSALLCLCMVIGYMPAVASAANAATVKIAGVTLNAATPYYINGAGSATNTAAGYNAYLDVATGTLNLDNLTVGSEGTPYAGKGIEWTNDVIMNLAGANNITCSGGNAIYADGNLTINGVGNLAAVSPGDSSIQGMSNVTFNATGIISATGNTGIGVNGTMTITQGTVNARGNAGDGIWTDTGKLIINGGTLTAKGISQALNAAPTLTGYAGTKTVKVSSNMNGTGATVWDGTTLSYNYFKIQPPQSWSYPGGAPSPFVLGTDGTATNAGTASNPYAISSAQDLANLSYLVNNGTTYSGKFFEMTDDIVINYGTFDASGTFTPTVGGTAVKSWTPIGKQTATFRGTFDGAEYSVNGIYTNNASNAQGLFGWTSTGASLKNIEIKDAYINGTGFDGGVAGYALGTAITNCVNKGIITSSADYAGGIVGLFMAGSTMTDCYNTGSISVTTDYAGGLAGGCGGAVINKCYNKGAISATTGFAGGVVGSIYNSGSVVNCYNEASVTSSGGERVGGVAGGSNGGKIENCYNTGAVAVLAGAQPTGGVVGTNGGTMINCYSTSTVQGTAPYVGGVVGYLPGGDTQYCYYNEDFYTGSVVGTNSMGSVSNSTSKTTIYLKSAAFVTLLNDEAKALNASNNIYSYWIADTGLVNGGYPILGTAYAVTFDNNGGSGTNPTYALAASGGTVTLPATSPTYAGYNFAGWYTAANGGTAFTGASVVTADKTVYAHWTSTNANLSNLTLSSGTLSPAFAGGTINYTASLANGVSSITVTPTVAQADATITVSGSAVSSGLASQSLPMSVGANTITVVVTASDTSTTKTYTITVTRAVAPIYTITASALTTFATLTAGYVTAPAIQTVTITNTGNQSITLTQPTATNYTIGALSTTTLGVGGTATFTVQPKTGLAAGDKGETISVAGTGGASTSAIAQFTVTAAPTYTITASTLTTFDSQTVGYVTAPASQTITITNTGSQNITLTQPTSSNFSITSLSAITIASGNTVTFTVQPKTGLAVGTYSETITIAGTNSASASVSASFTVNTSNTGGGHNSNSGSVTADPVKMTVNSGEEVKVDNLSKLVSGGDKLTVKSDLGTVVFDTTALSAIDSQTDSKITVVIEKATEEKLSDTQKTIVGDNPVYDLSVLSNGKKISDFKGGVVTITLPYTLKEDEQASGVVVWYLADDGTLTPVSCTYDAAGKAATFTVSHFSKYIVGYDTAYDAAWTNPFKDVAASAWYYESVGFAYQNNLMLGKSSTAFVPNGNTTRSMIVSILFRMEGQPATTAAAIAFKDVNKSAWYSDAVAWASANGIVSGYTGNTFAPEGKITREQLAAILYRYAAWKGMDVTRHADLSVYSDSAKVSSWADDALAYANAEGLISGVSSTKMDPSGSASRAQVAAILKRFIENAEK